MEAMRRWLLIFGAVLSLLLGAATVVLWVRSYFVADAFGWSWETGAVQAGAASGRLRLSELVLLDGWRYAPPHFAHTHYPPSADPPSTRLPARWWNVGFGFEHRLLAGQYESRVVLLPLWMVVLATMALPTLWFKRRRGATSGTVVCRKCGYDLRASHNRCPECGTLVSTSV